ncbi:MAG: hypothetical protein JWO67_5591 [Streptosporangiaceae bacterium]|nr:hypothetical protein [Streptosporangiaceae bacterium]
MSRRPMTEHPTGRVSERWARALVTARGKDCDGLG